MVAHLDLYSGDTIFGSNFSQVTGYPIQWFCGFTHSLQLNTEIIPSNRP
jgi:hypothetical protein